MSCGATSFGGVTGEQPKRVFVLLALLFCVASPATATRLRLYPIPTEVSSTHYRVGVNGRTSPVLHAADNYYLLNFDIEGPATITVTAADVHFWDAGVEIQPMRLGIRPTRRGASISFTIPGPEKLTISRPGDHFAGADMLFLFANPPEYSGITVKTAGIRYYGAGVHHENIDAHSGEKIYLDGGAVIFGSLNIWRVENVHVFGHGTIVYDGPQDPHADEGWMQKPNWHVVVMREARNIEIDGITCITRSRSWQIQMRESHHIGFFNIKVIGGNPNDANQDGMDWLGGGDTTVQNSFFRASDDVFALQGNWEGYEPELMRKPGNPVANITIESTIASTSISNTVRVGWPSKTFNSAHFKMSDIDVIHTGFGGCKVPFAFFELWADPDGRGSHEDYSFRNIRLEDWNSLLQVQQPLPQVRDVSFREVWPMDGPAMVPSVTKGDVSGFTMQDVSVQSLDQATPKVLNGATAPLLRNSVLTARFHYTDGILRPHESVTFTAEAAATQEGNFKWIFGDGSKATGREVQHRFSDDQGTLLDGSGRFRVLLHVSDRKGNQSWSSESVVVSSHPLEAYVRQKQGAVVRSVGVLGSHIEDQLIAVPVNGGYTFTLLTSLTGSLQIDDMTPASTPRPRPQVCGGAGNAVQPIRISVALRAGIHRIRVVREAGVENAEASSEAQGQGAEVLWEGPGLRRQRLPTWMGIPAVQ